PDRDLAWPGRLGRGVQGRQRALGDEAPAHALDGPQAGPEGRDDLLIVARGAAGGVREQEDAGVAEPACGPLAGGNQALEVRPLLRGQCDAIAVHRGAPALEGRALAEYSRNKIPLQPSIED